MGKWTEKKRKMCNVMCAISVLVYRVVVFCFFFIFRFLVNCDVRIRSRLKVRISYTHHVDQYAEKKTQSWMFWKNYIIFELFNHWQWEIIVGFFSMVMVHWHKNYFDYQLIRFCAYLKSSQRTQQHTDTCSSTVLSRSQSMLGQRRRVKYKKPVEKKTH